MLILLKWITVIWVATYTHISLGEHRYRLTSVWNHCFPGGSEYSRRGFHSLPHPHSVSSLVSSCSLVFFLHSPVRFLKPLLFGPTLIFSVVSFCVCIIPPFHTLSYVCKVPVVQLSDVFPCLGIPLWTFGVRHYEHTEDCGFSSSWWSPNSSYERNDWDWTLKEHPS